MTPDQIVDAVVEWASATVPEFVGSYGYIPTKKTKGFPDFVAEVETMTLAINDPRLPYTQLEGAMVEVFAIGMSIMCENDDPDAAARFLRTTAHTLLMSLVSDYTLGGRVAFSSPIGAGFDMRRPFVQYVDGTKAREATGTLIVGVPLDMEEPWL